MRKQLLILSGFLAFVLWVSAFSVTSVTAQTATPTPTPNPTPHLLSIGTTGAVSLKGNIIELNSGSFVVRSWGTTWQMNINALTKLYRKSGVLSFLGEFVVNDYIEARGTMNADGTIAASYVKDFSNAAGLGYLTGTLANLSGNTFTVVVSGVPRNVVAAPTVKVTLNGLVSSLASMQNGLLATVSGVWNREMTVLTATLITAKTPLVSVTVSPLKATLNTGSTQQFMATVGGISGTQVTWLVKGLVGGNAAVGTITSDGLYTAPTTIAGTMYITVSAKSVADPTKIGNATAVVTPTDYPPVGWQDGSDCVATVGWTCDSNNFAQALTVEFYKDGPKGAGGVLLGTTYANIAREIAVGVACGNYPNHGFKFLTPSSLRDGSPHPIYVYAVNLGASGATRVPLSGTPKSITCAPPPPTPPPVQ